MSRYVCKKKSEVSDSSKTWNVIFGHYRLSHSISNSIALRRVSVDVLPKEHRHINYLRISLSFFLGL